MKVFARKATAVKYLKDNQLIANNNIKKYFIINGYDEYIELIQRAGNSASYYEFIQEDTYINLFFDIEIYKETQPLEFEQHIDIVRNIKGKLQDVYGEFGLQLKFIVLKSHSDIKRSYHIIVRIFAQEFPIYFRGVKQFKGPVINLFTELTNKKIIDISVYREGLFRTYLSSKQDQNRPLVRDVELSDDFEPIETFVCYCPGANESNVVFMEQFTNKTTNKVVKETEESEIEVFEPFQKDLTDKDKDTVRKFVRKNYKYRNKDIREIVLNHELNCINVNLHDTFCFNMDREHKSNHQYIVIDAYSSKQKCHDMDCKEYKHNEISIAKFPKELNELLLKCLKVNKREQELIERAIQECKDYITNNFDENIEEIQFDRNEMVFKGHVSNTNMMVIRGTCTSCKLEHHITNTGYCLKCSVCNTIYPKNQLIPVDDRYKHLNNFWMNYHQLVNNGTVNININNYYGGEEEFSCDIQLDANIIKDKKLLRLLNECLDGHKVTKLAELMALLHKEYIYTGNDWFYFDGSKWVLDQKSLFFKKHMLELCNLFNKIKSHYENKQTNDGAIILIKNIKSLITKLNKPQLKEDILRESQLFYADISFVGKLNSKKHLVPFDNGVYNLLERTFRKAAKDDYINLTVGFKYDNSVRNREVEEFVQKVLPKRQVRDYVLKKMSECLNGDIPNTNFLMFIGDGANGKSQLLNLMKLAMGELGEKVEVTLLTRKRNNANEANSEKIKLMNKRFAFLSEPEDDEKINIGLLKELTGSEEIVARGLYQEAVSFVMEAKLFLACNELPEIKGEDTALWRRIRVIDFPSRFVDDPKQENEYKIDRTLPSRMREDITWRQTFTNMLLEYYDIDVPEPEEVKVKTNEYRQDNNVVYNWFDENVCFERGSKMSLKEACAYYFDNRKAGVKEKGKFRKELEKCIKSKYTNIENACQRTTVDGESFQGWQHIRIKD